MQHAIIKSKYNANLSIFSLVNNIVTYLAMVTDKYGAEDNTSIVMWV